MNKYLGIESSDGNPCECCGTPCPARRTVIQTESGEIRKLGSTCAGLCLKSNHARKAKSDEKLFVRIEKAKAYARKNIDNGVKLDLVRNLLSCWIRCEIKSGAIITHRFFNGTWINEAL